MIALPTLPSFSVAPITAMVLGLKRASKDSRSRLRASIEVTLLPVGDCTLMAVYQLHLIQRIGLPELILSHPAPARRAVLLGMQHLIPEPFSRTTDAGCAGGYTAHHSATELLRQTIDHSWASRYRQNGKLRPSHMATSDFRFWIAAPTQPPPCNGGGVGSSPATLRSDMSHDQQKPKQRQAGGTSLWEEAGWGWPASRIIPPFLTQLDRWKRR